MSIFIAVVPISRYVASGWKTPVFRAKRRLEDVAMPSANREKLRSFVEDFGKSRKWYLDRGISWQRGLLLYGPSGCGKTSTIIALASDYNSKVHKISLNNPLLTDKSLRKIVGSIRQQSIVYLEVSVRSSVCTAELG